MTTNKQSYPDSPVDSRYSSEEEKKRDSVSLMKDRVKRMENMSQADRIRAQLMQLKFKMEEYLEETEYGSPNQFQMFLNQYVSIIYQNKRDFAQDINITPVEFSQILNNHRKPSDSFLKKLVIHSEKVFSSFTSFKASRWIELYHHQLISQTMGNESKWRPDIEKEVKLSEPITDYKK